MESRWIPLAPTQQTLLYLKNAELELAVYRYSGNQCIITQESGRQAGTWLCLVWQILQLSLRDVPMQFLGIKWISGPHLWTCNQGCGRYPWHPAVSDCSLAENAT